MVVKSSLKVRRVPILFVVLVTVRTTFFLPWWAWFCFGRPPVVLFSFSYNQVSCFFSWVFLWCFLICYQVGCTQTFGEHNQCSLRYIFVLFIFPSLRIRQYLGYIDNVGVKRFVLLAIALLVFYLRSVTRFRTLQHFCGKKFLVWHKGTQCLPQRHNVITL